MKRSLRFHALAQRDFMGAAAWSKAQWGAKMTRRYLDEIERQISRIIENPMLGSDAELPRPAFARLPPGGTRSFTWPARARFKL